MGEPEPTRSNGYTKQQFLILVVLGAVNFLSALVYSIQAPFYPAEVRISAINISAFTYKNYNHLKYYFLVG